MSWLFAFCSTHLEKMVLFLVCVVWGLVAALFVGVPCWLIWHFLGSTWGIAAIVCYIWAALIIAGFAYYQPTVEPENTAELYAYRSRPHPRSTFCPCWSCKYPNRPFAQEKTEWPNDLVSRFMARVFRGQVRGRHGMADVLRDIQADQKARGFVGLTSEQLKQAAIESDIENYQYDKELEQASGNTLPHLPSQNH